MTSRWVDILVASVVVLVGWYMIERAQIALTDPDDWMSVHQIAIPDHRVGEDPEMLYDREVHRAFTAEWWVKLRRVEDDAPACTGGGRHHYEPQDKVSTVTLSWYVGRICDLPLGDYVARTVWRIDGGPVIRATSNLFAVTPEVGGEAP